MADAVGSAYYELEARDTKARATVNALEQHIQRAGGSAEANFANPVTRAGEQAAAGVNKVSEATDRVAGGFRDRIGGAVQGFRDKVGGAFDAISSKVGGLASSISSKLQPAFSALTGPMGIMIGGGVAAGITAIGIAALGASAQMETFEVQFETLLGSADAAEARIAELSEFAAKTPFQLPQVVQASRTLEVFTDGALSTGDSLRMIGDAAAATGVPMEEVSFWTGRLYAAMKGGQPIGEMTLRLSEMGIITPQTRDELEQLTKGIADGTTTMEEAWPRAEAAFGRFAGGMERQSQTLSGRFSTFLDDVQIALAELGDVIAPLAKDLLPLLGWAFSTLIDGIKVVVQVVGGIVNVFKTARDVITNFTMDVGIQGRTLRETAEDIGLSYDELKQRVQDRMRETGESFEEAVNGIKLDAEGFATETPVIVDRGMNEIRARMVAGGALIQEETEAQAEAAIGSFRSRMGAYRSSAYQSMVEYAKGLMDAQNEPRVALDAMHQMAAEALTKTEEIARLKGALASTELAAGLNDERESVRAAAEAARQAIIDRLAYLGADAEGWGFGIASELAGGMDNGYGLVINSAGDLAAAVRGQIAINSEPPSPFSPLRGITRWGGNIVKTLVDSGYEELGRARAFAHDLAAAVSPSFAPFALGGYGGAALAPAGGYGGGSVNLSFSMPTLFPATPEQARAAARAILPELQQETRRFGFMQ